MEAQHDPAIRLAFGDDFARIEHDPFVYHLNDRFDRLRDMPESRPVARLSDHFLVSAFSRAWRLAHPLSGLSLPVAGSTQGSFRTRAIGVAMAAILSPNPWRGFGMGCDTPLIVNDTSLPSTQCFSIFLM
jgi:hypothetical protein